MKYTLIAEEDSDFSSSNFKLNLSFEEDCLVDIVEHLQSFFTAVGFHVNSVNKCFNADVDFSNENYCAAFVNKTLKENNNEKDSHYTC